MALINNPFNISDETERLLNDVRKNPSFNATIWGDDILSEFRSIVRDHYRKEQSGRCAYCQKDISLTSPMNCHIEHIAPKSKYLQFIFEPKNLCVICADCNTIKREQETLQNEPDTLKKAAKRYPRVSGSFLIVHPHFDDHDAHILEFNQTVYVGITPKGEFTVVACGLNRKLRNFNWENELFDESTLDSLLADLQSAKGSLKKAALIKKLRKFLLLF